MILKTPFPTSDENEIILNIKTLNKHCKKYKKNILDLKKILI